MAETFPTSGSIDPKTFPFLIVNLHLQGATGSFKVAGPSFQKALYFRVGRILFGSSNDPRDQLGAILVEEGKITPEQLEDVNSKVGPGKPLAKVLAETGYVSQRELSDAARAKVERIVSDVIAYTAGSFEFEDGVLPKGAVDLKLSTERLVLGAVRRVSDRNFVLRHLDSLEVVLGRVGGTEQRLAELQADAGGLPEQLDGSATLKEAVSRTRLDEFEAAKVACALLFLGLVERTAPGGAAATESPVFTPADTGEELNLGGGPELSFAALEPQSAAAPQPRPAAASEPAPAAPLAAEPEPEPLVVSEPEPLVVSEPEPLVVSAQEPAFATVPEPELPGPELQVAAAAPPESATRPQAPPIEAPPPEPVPAETKPPQPAPPREPPLVPPPRREASRPAPKPPPPRPASKEDLAALDVLLNPRSTEGPLEPLDKGPAGASSFDAARGPIGSQPRRRLARTALFIAFGLVLVALPVMLYYINSPLKPVRPEAGAPVAAAGPAVQRTSPRPSPVAVSPGAPATASSPAATSASARSSGPAAVAAASPSTPPSPASAASPAARIAAAPSPVAPATTSAPSQRIPAAPDARALMAQGRFSDAARGFAAQVKAARPGSATVQLLVACSTDTLQKALENVKAPELFVLPIELKGRKCFRLSWGIYDSESRAAAAVRTVPEYFRTGGAAPRVVPIASISR